MAQENVTESSYVDLEAGSPIPSKSDKLDVAKDDKKKAVTPQATLLSLEDEFNDDSTTSTSTSTESEVSFFGKVVGGQAVAIAGSFITANVTHSQTQPKRNTSNSGRAMDPSKRDALNLFFVSIAVVIEIVLFWKIWDAYGAFEGLEDCNVTVEPFFWITVVTFCVSCGGKLVLCAIIRQGVVTDETRKSPMMILLLASFCRLVVFVGLFVGANAFLSGSKVNSCREGNPTYFDAAKTYLCFDLLVAPTLAKIADWYFPVERASTMSQRSPV